MITKQNRRMFINVFPVMLIELIICSCTTSRVTYLLALNVLYRLIETLYTSYYAIGLFTYIFALISYLPFIVSLIRMAWRDSETRRLIFYRSCYRLWMFTLAIDCWIYLNLIGSTDDLCQITGFLPDEAKIACNFGLDSISPTTMFNLCVMRIQVHRALYLAGYHLNYAAMVCVS